MTSGNKPLDGGHLVLSTVEKNTLLSNYPAAHNFIRKFIGSSEYIRGSKRWCIWLDDEQLDEALKIPELSERIEMVKKFRLSGGNNARNKANTPHRFEFSNEPKSAQIIVPRVSSERRDYIPLGFLDKTVVVADSAQVIYDPEPYVFSLLNSRMHMVWVDVTAGRLKSDYRYSSYYSYHTFPLPELDDKQKGELNELAMKILSARATHPEKTIAKMYDPEHMPTNLRQAHQENDDYVDSIYSKSPFKTDDERLIVLFNLYEKMTGDSSA